VFVLLLVYAATFEVLAWLAPGMQRDPEVLAAETYNRSAAWQTLALFWAVIGFLVFSLWQLARQKRADQETLYGAGPASSGRGAPGVAPVQLRMESP